MTTPGSSDTPARATPPPGDVPAAAATVSGAAPPYAGGERDAVQARSVRVLSAAQVLGGVGVAAGIAVGGLLAEEVSGSTALSGLAQTAAVLGGAIAALPMARVMADHGRRRGLAAGYAVGAVGAVVLVVAAVLSWFPLLLVGATLFGAATAAGLQARFAATDLASPRTRGRSLSTVVWATTVGAVFGPNLTGPGAWVADLLGLPRLAGPYVFSLAAFVLGAVVLALLLRPDPLLEARRREAVPEGAMPTPRPAPGPARPPMAVAPARPHASLRSSLAVVRRSPPAVLALSSVVLAHMVMVGVMVMTPVHMRHGGASLEVVGVVISVHVAGMYALSPVMGWLSDRWGRVPVILLGEGLLLAAVATTASAGDSGLLLGAGLGLLGLGWSAVLVSGSTLLSESVPAADRPGVQGTADFVMGMCAAGAGALAGVALETLGYGGLNAVAAVLVLPVVVLAFAQRRLSRRPLEV